LRIQIATGLRPKEIFNMRPMAIDRSGPVWVYRLGDHNSSWAGKRKAVALVDDALAAITDHPVLGQDPVRLAAPSGK